MKLLLYCTKAKPPYLRDYRGKAIFNRFVISPTDRPFTSDDTQPILNGKIVAECDFEIEKFSSAWYPVNDIDFRKEDIINDLKDNCPKEELEEELEQANLYFNLLENSCLTRKELRDYVRGTNWFYAIHLKNLHIFDTPKELSEYYKILSSKEYDTKINKLGYRPKEWLNVPVSETKYFATQSILEPLKKAPKI